VNLKSGVFDPNFWVAVKDVKGKFKLEPPPVVKYALFGAPECPESVRSFKVRVP
jgi:hypothetical protein